MSLLQVSMHVGCTGVRTSLRYIRYMTSSLWTPDQHHPCVCSFQTAGLAQLTLSYKASPMKTRCPNAGLEKPECPAQSPDHNPFGMKWTADWTPDLLKQRQHPISLARVAKCPQGCSTSRTFWKNAGYFKSTGRDCIRQGTSSHAQMWLFRCPH